MSVRAYTRIIAALEARDLHGRDLGVRAQFQCPAHEDREPSLSIADREDRALVYCHAGCDTLDVLEALGLDWSDLFDESATGKRWTTETLRRAARLSTVTAASPSGLSTTCPVPRTEHARRSRPWGRSGISGRIPPR
jgi:hypothetical protein